MAGLTLDAGALIAYERGQERIRKILAIGYERGFVPTIPAIALAEVWCGDTKDARIARLLKACYIEVINERLARAAGSLRRATPGAHTIDACIAVGVRHRGDAIATSDPHDMRALLGNGFTILHGLTSPERYAPTHEHATVAYRERGTKLGPGSRGIEHQAMARSTGRCSNSCLV